ncbi:MAG: UvrD-helicase domain-containing protein, partial [Bryobacteraceae bacterium]
MPVVDTAERRRALDPSRSFLVQAPAGSGKTELLIQRYLALLARVRDPESVLAITFTKKAAGEMRRRVLEALQAADRAAPETPHQARTLELARAVRAREAESGWALLENPHRLRIRTIDSLCVSLIRQMPWLSRSGAPAGIQEDAGEMYREAARRTVALVEDDEWFRPMSRLLLHLDNNVPALEGLFASMLDRRDQWLRMVGVGADRARQRAVLETALHNVVTGAMLRAREAVPKEFGGEIVALAAFAGANLEEPAAPLRACLGLRDIPETGPGALDAWLGIADLLLTKNGGWRTRVNAANGFPPGGTDQKRRWTELAGALRRREDVRAALLALRSLPPACFSDPQWEVVDALLTALPMAVAQLRVVFRERGVTDFNELTQAALRALGCKEHPADLALALDYRIEHILIDEFQDTSLSQFQLLEKLTLGWVPGDGRTLFAVGDPMQSIYRFREAEVGLFLNARRHGIGALRLEPLLLTANFRSEAKIVGWVNDTFSRVFPETEDVATGAIRFSESIPARDSAGREAVRVHAFSERDDAAEAARVAEIAGESRRCDPRATIAVLVRARSHLPAILEQLRAAGLQYRAVDIEVLAEVPVIGDLMALTRALLHAADRIVWLALLRA